MVLCLFCFLLSKMYDVVCKWWCDGVRDNLLGYKNLSFFVVYFDVFIFGDCLVYWKVFLVFFLIIKVEYKCYDGVIFNLIWLWSFVMKIIKDILI